MATVVFYVSGHGFGHASRQLAVINALGTLAPEVSIAVLTSARSLVDRLARVPIRFHEGAYDTGVVQLDSLHLDERATIAQARDFYRTFDSRVAAEACFLRDERARFVVSDAPPLACAAAAAAGIPAVVAANFTWDWIYSEYAEHLGGVPDLIPTISRAYAQALEGWRLPMHGGFESIEVIRDVPFVAHHAQHDPEDVRSRLGLPTFRPLVLSSFGGYGVRTLDLSTLDCLDDYAVVTVPERDDAGTPAPRDARVYHVSASRLHGSGLRYEDLIAAVDVVVSKPGYGIISDCIANGTPLLYTPRGRFAEYDVLVREMPRCLRGACINRDDLLAGRWRAALERLESAPPPPERPPTDGAQVIATMILERLWRP